VAACSIAWSRPVIYDPASDPKQFRALAERLFQVDRIRLLFGCYMSSTRKACCRSSKATAVCCFIRRSMRVLNIRGTASTPVLAPNQNSLQLAKFLLATYGNRFLLVGSNYVYPYESNRLMADFVVQGRGKVLDEIYVPLEAGPRISRSHQPDQEDPAPLTPSFYTPCNRSWTGPCRH